MAAVREIRRRRESIRNTEQITKAMKIVATVKLQKAREKAEDSKPYFQILSDTISSLLPYSQEGRYGKQGKTIGKKALVAITSNRGLAGGYNQNVVRLASGNRNFDPGSTVIYAIGKKGREYFLKRGYQVAGDYSELMEQFRYEEAAAIAYRLLDAWQRGEIGEIYLAYTIFKNTVTQIPTLIRLLPVEESGTGQSEETGQMNYEPEEESVLEALIPQYVGGMIYGALLEAAASENGARMNAMDAAANNAREMLDGLALEYNRARQGTITQELTEIIAGAAAIS